MTLPQDYIGVDIAKNWIDIFHLASARHERIATTARELARFARSVKGALVVLEASGGYERPVTDALARAGATWSRVNPRQAREFARATGRLAKTDRVDAEVLARMGRALELAPTAPIDPERAELAALLARRDALNTMIRAEKNRAATTQDPWLAKQVASLISAMTKSLETLEARIATRVEAADHLRDTAQCLRTVPGIGPIIAATLLARLPELGTLDEKRIAALAGLAPHACDSGLHRGKRRIWGGRADLRRALYIAGFIASRYAPNLKAFRERLQAAGKPTKLAIVACARKLLTILNAMIRDKKPFLNPVANVV